MSSGLKVNFHKSSLVGFNVDEGWLSSAVVILNCKVGHVPFKYLGLPIGANPRRIVTWYPVGKKVQKRFSSWSSNHLSFAGRLVLIKSILSAPPTYFLSFFKAPKGILKSLESVFKKNL